MKRTELTGVQSAPVSEIVAASSTPHASFGYWLLALRPKQWIKNLLVGAALVFANRLGDPNSVRIAAWAFLMFCLVSSAGYLVNDVVDRDRDRFHPNKRLRPVAAERILPSHALVGAGVLAILGLTGSVFIAPAFAIVAAGYAALTVAYSLFLKQFVGVDVVTISAGFVLRALAGAVAIGVPMSWWLASMTGLLALFIALGKRRSEVHTSRSPLLAQAAPDLPTALGRTTHRISLQEPVVSAARGYSTGLLDPLLILIGSAVVVVYVLYAAFAGNLPRDHIMLITVPIVAFGLWRYAIIVGAGQRFQAHRMTPLLDSPGSPSRAVMAYHGTLVERLGQAVTGSSSRLDHVRAYAGAPEEAILRDMPLLIDVIGWALMTVCALYWVR